jgi:uncharacterized protein (DUF2062 family)
MVPAGITAYLLRFNVPAAISLVWVTNPITWPVILYWQYRLGLWLMGKPAPSEIRVDQLSSTLSAAPVPLLVGCVVTGVIAFILTILLVNLLWSFVIERWWESHSAHRQVHPGKRHPKNNKTNDAA